jgi:hypothetical protein
MRVLSSREKEAINLRKDGLNFSFVAALLAQPCLDEPDGRPLGHEHEGWWRFPGRIGPRVLDLIVEPVEQKDREIAAKPISLRDATRAEECHY